MTAATFFDPHQRGTVEAAMARIIPTDDQPGAREAGAIDFVDRYLSGIGFIYAKPDGSGFETLEGKPAEAWQQRIDILRRTYVEGIAALDLLCRARVRRRLRRTRCRTSRTRRCAALEAKPGRQSRLGRRAARARARRCSRP